MEEEIWKDIPGYEGRYQASTLGRIRSLDRVVVDEMYEKKRTRFYRGRILKHSTHPSGHLMVHLGNSSPQKVHRLVLATFVGPCPDNCEVLHQNGIPSDNRLSNLRYGTRTENIIDVLKQSKKWRRLDVEQVKQIRQELRVNPSASAVAKKLGLRREWVKDVKIGRTFAWLRDES